MTETPSERLEAIRRQMAAVAADRPTPEQIAEWNAADKEMAQRIRAALPGVPLHHAYAVLRALRTAHALETAATPAGPAPATDQAALVEGPQTVTHNANESTARLHDEILTLRADLAKVRDLLRTENQRGNDAIDREETAETDALEAQQDLRRLRLIVDEYGAGASALTGKLKQLRDIGHRLAAHAVGFQDELDASDRGPWARTVGADIAELCAVLDAPAAPVLPASIDRADVLAALVRDFLDPDPCRLDHHGYCQAHSWMCSGSRCPHARAREVLAEIDSDEPALRRMADETPQPFEGSRDSKTSPKADSKADVPVAHSCPNCEGIDPGTCLTNRDRPAAPAVVAQPDEEADRG